MKYVLVWRDHGPGAKKELTPRQVEDVYMWKYPDLKVKPQIELVRAMIRRERPKGISKERVWKYLIYAVVDCGVDLSKVWTM